ncbi:MAG: Hsp20/alpha crystallin family protein [Rhodospirillaceae bacterium]|nr:Hsp20/alpha crystallin family protein [Rhodospirillaceae bacterium]
MNLRNLVPWSRNRPAPASLTPMLGLQDEINRMFDEVWRGFGPPTALSANWRGPLAATLAGWPAVDVKDSDKAVDVSFELPGLSESDVDLTLENDTLTVKGEKREETTDKTTGYSERSYGAFERSVALPPGLLADKAEAAFKNGVLTVSIPKSKETQSQAKRIPIKA